MFNFIWNSLITGNFIFQAHSLTEDNVVAIGAKAEGYSGADMSNLCKEAAMGPIRSLDYSKIDEVRNVNKPPNKQYFSTFIWKIKFWRHILNVSKGNLAELDLYLGLLLTEIVLQFPFFSLK